LRTLISFLFLFATASAVHAQALSLGAHTLLGQEEGNGVSPALTQAVDTATSGSVLLAFNAGYASNFALPTDNKSNIWSALGAPVIYNGYGGAFDVKAYAVANANGGSGHRLSVLKNGNAAGEMTVPLVEIRNARIVDVAQNYPASGALVRSAAVQTTGPAILVAFWWGDGGGLNHTAVPSAGFSILDSFLILPPNSAVQCAVATRSVASAGSYNVSWTQSPAQGAVLWLFALQARDLLLQDGFE
jgi:hypothetical protein